MLPAAAIIIICCCCCCCRVIVLAAVARQQAAAHDTTVPRLHVHSALAVLTCTLQDRQAERAALQKQVEASRVGKGDSVSACCEAGWPVGALWMPPLN